MTPSYQQSALQQQRNPQQLNTKLPAHDPVLQPPGQRLSTSFLALSDEDY